MTMSNNSITKRMVQQQLKKSDVDSEHPEVELYFSEYRNQNCVNHSTNTKSCVFNGDQLFLASYPYSIELDLAQPNQEFEFEKCRFFEAHEGTLIRVFNIKGNWYTATNRRLNAFNSKWAAKTTTFGLHFADAVRENIRALNDDEFFEDEEESFEEKKKSAKNYLSKIYDDNLDKSKKYMFLLEPCKEERIVCLTNSPRFFNIGVFDKDNNLSLDEDVTLGGFLVPKPKELVFEDMGKMRCALENIDYYHLQGFIAIQNGGEKHFKILNEQYKYLFKLRNNVSSIRFRFLQLEHQNTVINLNHGTNQQTTAQTEQMLNDFCNLYRSEFDPQPLLTYIWSRVVEDLFVKYQDRYIKKQPDPTVSNKQDMMLKEIHRYFNESVKAGHRRQTDRLRIRDILAMQKPSDLNQLIAEYEKKDKDAERERRMK